VKLTDDLEVEEGKHNGDPSVLELCDSEDDGCDVNDGNQNCRSQQCHAYVDHEVDVAVGIEHVYFVLGLVVKSFFISG